MTCGKIDSRTVFRHIVPRMKHAKKPYKEAVCHFQRDFFQKLADQGHGEELFNYLPDTLFFIKDRQGRFVKVNQAFLDHFGFKDESELVGKTDRDMVPPYLARQYVKDDRAVMQRGSPLIRRVELVTGRDCTINWHITSKAPLRDTNHAVIGIAGITRFFKEGTIAYQSYADIFPVIDHIRGHLFQPININTLARLAHLSLSAFERKFKMVFHVSPLKYINIIRIQEACKALINSNKSIAQVAVDNGFCDQSHFSRTFLAIMGTTPKRYRTTHALNLTATVS